MGFGPLTAARQKKAARLQTRGVDWWKCSSRLEGLLSETGVSPDEVPPSTRDKNVFAFVLLLYIT